jgi:hypothetical protein
VQKRNLKTELPSILLLGIYQKACKSDYNKEDTCTPIFIATLFIHSRQTSGIVKMPYNG